MTCGPGAAAAAAAAGTAEAGAAADATRPRICSGAGNFFFASTRATPAKRR